MDPYKLHVKLGQAEFNAEGPEQIVREQFELFLRALNEGKGKPLAPTTPAPGPPVPPEESPDPEPAGLPPEVRDRAFVKDAQGMVSLRVLPRTSETAADTLLLIMYGYKTLKALSEVPVIDLLRAAKQSGVPLDRIDRSIAPRRSLVNKGGLKRGSRYGLNNQGVAHVEKLLRSMFC